MRIGGKYYTSDDDEVRDYMEALRYIELASETDNKFYSLMGMIYNDGKAVKKTQKKLLHFLKLAPIMDQIVENSILRYMLLRWNRHQTKYFN